MASSTPKGWDKDSDKLFIHDTGVRIQRMTYKGKEGWFLVPVDLDAAVLEFEPTPEGRDKAFEAFAKGAIPSPRKPKPPPRRPPPSPPPPRSRRRTIRTRTTRTATRRTATTGTRARTTPPHPLRLPSGTCRSLPSPLPLP